MHQELTQYSPSLSTGGSIEITSCLCDYMYNESVGKAAVVFNPDPKSDIIALTADILTTTGGDKSFRIDFIRRPSEELKKKYDADDSPALFTAPQSFIDAVKNQTGEHIQYTEWYTGAQFSLATMMVNTKINELAKDTSLSSNPEIREAMIQCLSERAKEISPDTAPSTTIAEGSTSATQIQSQNTAIGM